MTPRRITAALCLAAIVLLLWGAFSKRWFVGEMRSYEINGNVLIGLTGITACVATADVTRCESVQWSQVAPHSSAGTWMWLGRLTFGLSIAASIVLLAIAVLSLINMDLHSPISLPRWSLRLNLSLLPLLLGYYLFTPSAIGDGFSTGRGFLLVALGAITATVAAGRELEDRWG